MKKVEIPQFLGYQVRVHGLTARQYFILLVGAVVSASCWESFSAAQRPFAIACVIAIIIGMLILAFLHIFGRAVEEWITIILIWAIQPEKLQGKAFQRAFHRIKTIGEGIVELNEGRYLAIIEVKGYYFSELEQEQQFEAFSEFLSGLSFTVSLRICMQIEANHESIIPSSNLPTSLRRLHAHYLSYRNERMLAQPSRIVTCFLILSAGKHPQCREYISAVLSGLEKAKLPCRLLSSEKEIMTFYHLSEQEKTIAARFRAREIRFDTASGGHHYGAGLVVSKLPGSLSIGWLAQFMQQQQEPYDIWLSFQPVDDQQITNQLERKAVQLGGALLVEGGQKRNGVSRHMTKHALKEIEALQERLILKQSHLLNTTLAIYISTPSRTKLRIRIKSMRLQLRSLNIMATPLYFEHHLAFLSGMYGSSLLPSHAYLLPTEAAASFYPFLRIPHIGPGVLLGATGGDLISFDPEGRMNNNLAVLGIPGAGKSFFLKILSARLSFYPQISIIIIDIEGEYTKWAETVKAHQTIFAESLNMNPFSLNQTHSLREKLSFLVGLIGLLAGEQGELTQHEKALVVSAVLKSYSDYGINDDPTTHSKTVPSMADFLQNLQIEKAHELAYRLEIYRHIFPHSNKTDDVNATHQVFNLHDLPTELRTIAMYLIIERLSSLLYENDKARKHLIIIDEVWFLLKSRLGANFLNEFARRARKYNVGLWVGTQQVQDLLAEQQGNFKGLLDLCETKLLFRQEIDNLEKLLKLNASEEKFLHNAGRGEALYLTSKERLMISVLASEREQVFARGANT